MTNPPNSSHPTSLEAQAEKSEIVRYTQAQDDSYTPTEDGECVMYEDHKRIVEALKAEVEELRLDVERWTKDYSSETESLQFDKQSLRKQIEQLTAELERAQQTNKAYESLKALEGRNRQTP